MRFAFPPYFWTAFDVRIRQATTESIMTLRIGYLLPTRESIMEGRPEAEPLLALAERAERLGYDSVWVGDSLLARPRHEPITLLAGVAGRTQRVRLGTAVRSEEHTSELQSLRHLVCRLLLEKKKT